VSKIRLTIHLFKNLFNCQQVFSHATQLKGL